jgi:hypothetical protein
MWLSTGKPVTEKRIFGNTKMHQLQPEMNGTELLSEEEASVA